MFNFGIFFLTSFLGAAVGTLVKLLVVHLDPLTIVATRFFLGLLIIAPFTFKKQLIRRLISDKFLISAGILFSLNVIFFAIGIQYTSLIMGLLLYVFTPLIVAIIGYIFLKEKLTNNQIVGLLLSLVGISILIWNSFKTADIFSFGKPLGNFLIGIAVLSWSLYIVISRKNTRKFNPWEITFTNFVMACIISILALGPLIANGDLNYSFNLKVDLVAVCLAIVALLFIVAYQFLIKNTSAFISSLNLYVQVIWSTALGIILFNERLKSNLILGALLIITGVFLATSYQYIKIAKGKIWT